VRSRALYDSELGFKDVYKLGNILDERKVKGGGCPGRTTQGLVMVNVPGQVKEKKLGVNLPGSDSEQDEIHSRANEPKDRGGTSEEGRGGWSDAKSFTEPHVTIGSKKEAKGDGLASGSPSVTIREGGITHEKKPCSTSEHYGKTSQGGGSRVHYLQAEDLRM